MTRGAITATTGTSTTTTAAMGLVPLFNANYAWFYSRNFGIVTISSYCDRFNSVIRNANYAWHMHGNFGNVGNNLYFGKYVSVFYKQMRIALGVITLATEDSTTAPFILGLVPLNVNYARFYDDSYGYVLSYHFFHYWFSSVI